MLEKNSEQRFALMRAFLIGDYKFDLNNCKDLCTRQDQLEKEWKENKVLKEDANTSEGWAQKINFSRQYYMLKAKVEESSVEAVNAAHAKVIGSFYKLGGLFANNSEMVFPRGCMDTSECIGLQKNRDALQIKRDQALEIGELIEANVLSLKIALIEEKLSLLEQGLPDNSVEISALESKNLMLEEVLSGNRPAYNSAEKAEVDKVKQKFGDLYIGPVQSEQYHAALSKDMRPWAAHWYPFRYHASYEGSDAPLQKFDDLLEAEYGYREVVKWEVESHSTQAWESSDGLCDAWSVAASLTKEPRKSVVVNDVEFSPAAIKGLLIQKYSNFKKDRYGVPYRGYIQTDGMAQDLRPEAFHTLVTSLLAKGTAPIVDTDPNFPIWNMPLFDYSWKVDKDTKFENAVIVTANARYIKFRSAVTSEPTKYFGRPNDVYAVIYRYRLFLEPESIDQSKRKVLYGEWLIDEIASSYPDTVYVAHPDTPVTPRNHALEKHLGLLNTILEKASL